MNEGPYRGHVPVKKPRTFADSLREYTKAAKEALEKEYRAQADVIWPTVVDRLTQEAKEGAVSLLVSPEVRGDLLKNVPLSYFEGYIKEAGLEIVQSPYSTGTYISWTLPKVKK